MVVASTLVLLSNEFSSSLPLSVTNAFFFRGLVLLGSVGFGFVVVAFATFLRGMLFLITAFPSAAFVLALLFFLAILPQSLLKPNQDVATVIPTSPFVLC